MFVASVLYLLCVHRARHEHAYSGSPYDGYLNIIQMILWGLIRRRLLHSPVLGAAATLHHA